MPHCPNCHSTNLRRSATRNRWERWRKEITGKRPYRCRACQWRGWKSSAIDERDSSASDASGAPDPPNLKGATLARIDSRTELDLKELDRFHGSSKNDA